MNNEKIEHYLKYDAIAEAEKITKGNYNTDGLTQRVATLNFIIKNRKLTKELINGKDSYRGMAYLDFINLVMNQGFVPVYHENFKGQDALGTKYTEALIALYHQTKGIFLTAESFGGKMVNQSRMYYNWVPNQEDKEWYRATSSGGFEKSGTVWAGYHEAHEAMRYKLDLMHKKGYFVQQWVEQPITVWLTNYMEQKDKNFPEVNKLKLRLLPEYVKKAMLIQEVK